MDPITGGVVKAVATEGFKKLVSSVLQKGQSIADQKKLESINKKAAEDLYSKIIEIRKVKTIQHRSKAIDLRDFYCTPHLLIDGNRIKANSIREIPLQGNLIIEGMAGQGKSIFMRHISSREVELESSVPIFIELKNIQDQDSLAEHIIKYLSAFEFTVSKDRLLHFLNNANITLFLDGFDELSEKAEPKIYNEIENIARQCFNLKILISTRPNRSIASSAAFRVLKIDNLKDEEYKEIIEKIYPDSNQLIAEIEGNHKNTKTLLLTPLLVTLLVLYHQKNSRLPQSLYQYYENIFDYHHHIHDDNKPLYNRSKKCNLSETDFRAVFTVFCFELIRESPERLDLKMLRKLVVSTQNQLGKEFDPDHYINDLVKITCLLIEEGGDYSLIHDTIKEYFAAAFVSERPESKKKDFYTSLLAQQKRGQYCHKWLAILKYLDDVDKFCYYKYYALPEAKYILIKNSVPPLPPPIRDEHIERLFAAFSLEIEFDLNTWKFKKAIATYPFFIMNEQTILAFNGYLSILVNSDDLRQKIVAIIPTAARTVQKTFKIADLINLISFRPMLSSITEMIVLDRHALALQAVSYIRLQENDSSIRI